MSITNASHIPVKGFRLHIFRELGGWTVWLNTEIGDFDGLCLSTGGKTREQAMREAHYRLRDLTNAIHVSAGDTDAANRVEDDRS